MRAARESGILLRDFGKSLPGCIRITVGERSENDRLLALFAEIDGGTP
jgi:histidinol-phosphate/aromatic aminotransferase/cobyric acid decarboxylase-like protein